MCMGLNPSLFNSLVNSGFSLVISITKPSCPDAEAICKGLPMENKLTVWRIKGFSRSNSCKSSMLPI
ncbi:hypothetical protein SLEP1_g52576 [Rubroshorea leprosula]|uniref:Uncharacterized protein n=1 Tax=Rubroshorea leprosula TaxID=152421 RepID=A0AAV5M902_9ROSI|nr:hypothetical protein SLEP1_g52576 [Rubroshorea leprosula]